MAVSVDAGVDLGPQIRDGAEELQKKENPETKTSQAIPLSSLP